MTKEELTQVLSEAGQVVDVYIPTDRVTGRPRGFAFATFSTEQQAAEAIRIFNQRDVGGRRLNVNAAEERPRRPPGSGFGGDRGGAPGGGGRPGYGGGGARPGYGGGGGRPGYGGDRFAGPPPAEDLSGFDGGRYQPDDEAPPGGNVGGDPPKRFPKGKGSRRGLRARKRSL
jgi:cold-inducible RNA-binding protein